MVISLIRDDEWGGGVFRGSGFEGERIRQGIMGNEEKRDGVCV